MADEPSDPVDKEFEELRDLCSGVLQELIDGKFTHPEATLTIANYAWRYEIKKINRRLDALEKGWRFHPEGAAS